VSYDANSIETLEFVDAIRKRIEMYMGSADNQGVLQCIREVISNSIDEYSIGYGDRIEITVDTDKNIFTCRDYARSIPFGIRDDGTEAMIATFMSAHTGGKFNDKQYGNAVIGQNGIGVKGVALSSENFKAISYRDNQCATLILHRGKKISYTVASTKEKNGTYIEFSPSPDVYRLEEIHMNFQDICQMCEDWSYLNKGLTFILKDIKNNKTKTYYSKNGIADFIKSKLTPTIQKEPYVYFAQDDEGNKMEIGFLWGSKKEMAYVFTNGLHNLNGGTSLTGAKTAITRTMNQFLKNNMSGDFVRNNLCYVINAKVPHASFSDQTKMKVNNISLRPLADKAFTEGLKQFANTHKDEFNSVIELLKKMGKAEAAADKARAAVLSAGNEIEKNQRKKVFASDKLKDAEFLGQNSILLAAEGLSASSSLVQGRDHTKYGVLALRGKIINCLSNSDEDIFENEEIKLLLSALNIIPGKYDNKKLRYGKLGICVDAD
jgi:DNA gyrase/topoisomerase IV subunit B